MYKFITISNKAVGITRSNSGTLHAAMCSVLDAEVAILCGLGTVCLDVFFAFVDLLLDLVLQWMTSLFTLLRWTDIGKHDRVVVILEIEESGKSDLTAILGIFDGCFADTILSIIFVLGNVRSVE